MVEGAVGDWRPDLVNKSAENNSFDCSTKTFSQFQSIFHSFSITFSDFQSFSVALSDQRS